MTPTRLQAEVKNSAHADQLAAVVSPTMTPSTFIGEAHNTVPSEV